MSLKTSVRKHEFTISIIGTIVGVFLLLIGLFGAVLSSPAALESITEPMGNWVWWALVFGIILVFIFALVIIFRYKNLQEFKDLYETESKSKFRKNIVRIETLALKLGPEYEEKVIEKEEELNIRR